MKATVNKINKGLEFLTKTKIESLEVKISDLKASFIDEQLKAFNVDLNNKTAQQTINMFMVGVEFSKSVNADLRKKVAKFKEESLEDTEKGRYLKEVERIANNAINGAYAPITIHTNEMQKALLCGDLKTFNAHMVELLGIELSQKQLDTLALMTISSKRTELDIMSSNQFKNLIMHIFTKKLTQADGLSVKKVTGCLKKAIKDVPTISYVDAQKIENGDYSTSLVDEMVTVLGITYKEGEKDYKKLVSKVRKALHSKVAVLPQEFEENK